MSALSGMNGDSVSLHLLTGGRVRKAARGNETDRNIYIPAHKYFTKISVGVVLKKRAVSAMIEVQKRRTTIGRLLLHMLGDLTAHVGSRAVISFLWQRCSQ